MPDDALNAALERVDRDGDVSQAMDPTSFSLRDRMEREFLIRFDEDLWAYVLTQAGRQRLTDRHRPKPETGTVTPFRRRTAPEG